MHIEPIARPRRAMRLAPLVDVVFLLLVFFMLVSRLDVPQTIAVEPPSAAGSGALQGAVLVRVADDGDIDLNGLPIGIDALPDQIASFLERDPDLRVLVQVAQHAMLQDLVHVVDRLRTAGAEDLTLIEP
jgi:biopolymer transport protein ExbD